ncbi:MAG: hypothetical protein ACE5O2_08720 [Armatimonadota bacterium]
MRTTVPAVLFVAASALNPGAAWPQAFPINSDVALQPAEGQVLYRAQIRYRNFRVERPGLRSDVWIQANVVVYGWTSRLSTVLAVPLVYRDLRGPAGSKEDFGVGDAKCLVRYQLWKKLGYLESRSWTVIGGVEVPSYDDPFSSRSWDPVLGTVYSWRLDRYGFDADVVWQSNTPNDRGLEAGDELRYDLAFQRRLWPRKYASDTRWSLVAILGLNGRYQWKSTTGAAEVPGTNSHQAMLSPGLVLAGRRARYEAGVQIPVTREVGDSAPEDRARAVVGLTLTF